VLVLVAACSPSESTTSAVPTTVAPTTTAAAAFPVTVAGDNGQVTIEERPVAIVSLSPTATESLFAIGAGDQVIAVDDRSDYPAEAPVSELSGFTPNVEAIAALRPDLVVISFDPGDLVSGLNAVGIPVLMQDAAATLDEAYDQIEQLGIATGNGDEAGQVVAGMQGEIEAIVVANPPTDPPLTYYHELGPELYSLTSSTFAGSIYSLLGLQNIADPADADGAAFGYPQLSAEFIVEADPDLIFLADTICCQQNEAAVKERPGWDTLTAVNEGGVVELNDDVASRWGPRIVDFLQSVADGVAAKAG
jgi:iron complex transport system substrate-binding protein